MKTNRILFQINHRNAKFILLALLSCLSYKYTNAQCSDCLNINCSTSASALGDCSFAQGDGSTSGGSNSISMGKNASAIGLSSVALGERIICDGDYAAGLGYTSNANGDFSIAIGTYVKSISTATANFVIGKGVSSGSTLDNSTNNSLKIGFNSTVPTIFVTGGSGAGTYGMVGIGTASAPVSLLHVEGTEQIGTASSVTGILKFYNSASANFTAFQAGNASSGVTYTLPTADGTNGQVLTTNGSAILSWGAGWAGSAWLLNGNSGTTAGTNFIGTTDNVDFIFKTNNSEKARMTAIGNFGIGTSSPTSIFHTIASGAKTAAYTGNFLSCTATSSTSSITKAALEIQSTGSWAGTSASNIGLLVSSVTGGTNNYDAIFNGGGNVGIGTNSPADFLHMHKPTETAIYTRYTNSLGVTGFRLGIEKHNRGEIRMVDDRRLSFFTNDSERMRIDSTSGFVGIEVRGGSPFHTPRNLLHLHQNDNSTPIYLQLTNLSSTSTSANRGVKIGIRYDGSNSNAELIQEENGPMVFFTSNSTNTYERVRINSEGNFGIGTNNPTSLLHTVASGAQTVTYTGNLLTNSATSSTSSINKYGVQVTSTGTWNGSASTNTGFYVSSVTGGTTNYDAVFNGGNNVGIGLATPASKLEIKGSGTTSSSSSLNVTNSSGNSMLHVRDDGRTGIGTTSPGSKLEVKGSGTTSSSSALNVTDNSGNTLFFVQDDGEIGIGTSTFTANTSTKLKSTGDIAVTTAGKGFIVKDSANGNCYLITTTNGVLGVIITNCP